MNKRRGVKISALFMALVLMVAMIPNMAFASDDTQAEDIIILFTGDVHGQADENIGYAGLAACKNELQSTSPYVALVDAGDSMSGSLLSLVSEGAYSVQAMNQAGYLFSVPGVHDFDYGVSRFVNQLAADANFSYLSCNLISNTTSKQVFEPYKVVTFGDKKVAFIGISDPQTIEKSSADFDGNYNFSDGADGSTLYARVQIAIENARANGADYIIAVGHLISDSTSPYSAQAVIKNTSGLTAFIQGNSHTASVGTKVKDANGNIVLLTCAGNGLKNIGVLRIKSNQTLEAQILNNYSKKQVSVQDAISKLKTRYTASLTKSFAETTSRLEAVSTNGRRTIDEKETNLGDLLADAYLSATGADVAIVESKEVKTSLELGAIRYKDVMNMLPDGNSISVAEVSGADLMDAIEMSARLYPNSNGGFFQVSGLTYDIQETVIPSVSLDGFGKFQGVSGEYRVTNIMINGKELDLFGTYKVAGTDSLLRGLTGYTMFENGTILQADVTTDQQAFISYLSGELSGAVGGHYAKSQGRMDSIRLVRQSELEGLLEDKVSDYEKQIAQLEEELQNKKDIIAIGDMTIKASSKFGRSSGKRYITVSWKASEKVDGIKYQIQKSQKKSIGYSKVKTTSSLSYKNSSGLVKGKTYYYRVRGYKKIDGKTYYTSWSNVVSRKVSK